jgi:hypothetical protein
MERCPTPPTHTPPPSPPLTSFAARLTTRGAFVHRANRIERDQRPIGMSQALPFFPIPVTIPRNRVGRAMLILRSTRMYPFAVRCDSFIIHLHLPISNLIASHFSLNFNNLSCRTVCRERDAPCRALLQCQRRLCRPWHLQRWVLLQRRW